MNKSKKKHTFEFSLDVTEYTDKYGVTHSVDMDKMKQEMDYALRTTVLSNERPLFAEAERQDTLFDYQKKIDSIKKENLKNFDENNEELFSDFVYYFVETFGDDKILRNNLLKNSYSQELIENRLLDINREKEINKQTKIYEKLNAKEKKTGKLTDKESDDQSNASWEIRRLKREDPCSLRGNIKEYICKTIYGKSHHYNPYFSASRDKLKDFFQFILEGNIFSLDDVLNEDISVTSVSISQDRSSSYMRSPKLGALLFFHCMIDNNQEAFDYLVEKGLNSSHMVTCNSATNSEGDEYEKVHDSITTFILQAVIGSRFWRSLYIQESGIKIKKRIKRFTKEEKKEIEELKKSGENQWRLELLLGAQDKINENYRNKIEKIENESILMVDRLNLFKKFLDLLYDNFKIQVRVDSGYELCSINHIKRAIKKYQGDSNIHCFVHKEDVSYSSSYSRDDEFDKLEAKVLASDFVKFIFSKIKEVMTDDFIKNHTFKASTCLKLSKHIINHLSKPKLELGSDNYVEVDEQTVNSQFFNQDYLIKIRSTKEYNRYSSKVEFANGTIFTPDQNEEVYITFCKRGDVDDSGNMFIVPLSQFIDKKDALERVCAKWLKGEIKTETDFNLVMDGNKDQVQKQIRQKIEEIERLKTLL